MIDDLAGQIRRDLKTIRDNYDETLEPAKRSAGSQAIAATKEPPLPIGAHILDVRIETFKNLHYWCTFILDNMRGNNGAELSTRVDPTVYGMTVFVGTWAEQIMDRFPEDAINLARETGKAARGLSGIIQETGVRKFTIGGCPEHGTNDLGERIPCRGELRALLRKDDDLLPSELACSVDPEHQWPAREWMQLGKRIVVVEEIA